MHRLPAVACAGLLAFACPAWAQSGPSHATDASQSQSLDQHDRQFIDHAAKDNQGEIRLCLLAEKKAEQPAVRAFARLMVDDHIAIESQLASLVNEQQDDASRGSTQEDQKTSQQLQSLHGREFDSHFMQAQIKDHRNDVETFRQEMQATRNRRVWALTATTLPILQQHLALAEAVEHTIGQGGAQAKANSGQR